MVIIWGVRWANGLSAMGIKPQKRSFFRIGSNYFSKIGVVELKIQTNELLLGDQIIITGPTTGVYEGKVGEIRLNRNPVNSAAKGALVSFKTKRIGRKKRQGL